MANAIDDRGERTASAKKSSKWSAAEDRPVREGIGQVPNAKEGGVLAVKKGAVPAVRANQVVRGYYAKVYSASPEDRIVMIRQGVPASDAKKIIKDLGVEQKLFYNALGLKTATVNRRVKRNDPLSSDESERLLGVAKLVGQLETMVSESGEPNGFDAAQWISRWLREPLPALRGEKPISFLDTMEGQALVSDALARIQSGAYA